MYQIWTTYFKQIFCALMKKIRKLFIYLYNNPSYTILYAASLLKKGYICEVKLLRKEDLSEKIRKGASLIRFGDGDVYIANGGNQSYQITSKTIRERLFEIFKSTYFEKYVKQNSLYIIGVPSRYLTRSNDDLRKDNTLQCWLPFKIAFKNYFNKSAYYFDSHLFYQTGSFEHFIAPYLVGKNVLFVSNKSNIEKIKIDGSSQEYKKHYLETKDNNSFEEYASILKEILYYKKKYNNLRVVLATGTASKILAYDLCQKGVICYDVGWGILYTKGENKLQEQLIIDE